MNSIKILQILKQDYEARFFQSITFLGLFKYAFFCIGFRVVVLYRIGCWMNERSSHYVVLRLITMLLKNHLLIKYSVELSFVYPAGPGLVLPHPHNLVVGRGARLGSNITIYNGVTLGALRTGDSDDCNNFPKLHDHVTVFTGAKVLGDISVGSNSVIAANSVVLKSCPSNSLLGGVPARLLKLDKTKHD